MTMFKTTIDSLKHRLKYSLNTPTPRAQDITLDELHELRRQGKWSEADRLHAEYIFNKKKDLETLKKKIRTYKK